MSKSGFFLILFTFTAIFQISAGTELRSSFNSDGIFINRLRLEYGVLNLSLLSAVSTDGIEYIEPDFFSPVFCLGRINLKGAVREWHNPDGLSPVSSVFAETTAVKVTDSISRSSRYGGVFIPPAGVDVSSWIFRSNAGQFSGGIAADSLGLIELPGINFCTDLLLSAGEYDENRGSEWFSTDAVLPQQAGINMAAELRFAAGSIEHSGRRMMKPDFAEPSAAFGIFASGSFPQYTEQGYLVRVTAAAGMDPVWLTGLFQAVTPEYIAPSGKLPSNSLITGAGFGFILALSGASILGSADYCLKQKMPEIRPARLIAQIQTFNAEIRVTAGILMLSADGDYKIVNESSGVSNDSADAGLRFSIDADYIRINIDGDWSFDDIRSYTVHKSFKCGANADLVLEPVRLGIGCDYDFESFSIKSDMKVQIDNGILFGGVEIINGIVNGFSIGFETGK